MNVMIATPCYGGQVHACFTISLIRAFAEFTRLGIGDRCKVMVGECPRRRWRSPTDYPVAGCAKRVYGISPGEASGNVPASRRTKAPLAAGHDGVVR